MNDLAGFVEVCCEMYCPSFQSFLLCSHETLDVSADRDPSCFFGGLVSLFNKFCRDMGVLSFFFVNFPSGFASSLFSVRHVVFGTKFVGLTSCSFTKLVATTGDSFAGCLSFFSEKVFFYRKNDNFCVFERPVGIFTL